MRSDGWGLGFGVIVGGWGCSLGAYCCCVIRSGWAMMAIYSLYGFPLVGMYDLNVSSVPVRARKNIPREEHGAGEEEKDIARACRVSR